MVNNELLLVPMQCQVVPKMSHFLHCKSRLLKIGKTDVSKVPYAVVPFDALFLIPQHERFLY